MPRFLVGLDDTDNAESIGTGALARELMLSLQRRWAAVHEGITRHQLLVHPDIPYTSHNSAACLRILTDRTLEQVAGFVDAFMESLLHEGADPAYCVVDGTLTAGAEWLALGQRCQTEVVPRSAAYALIEGAGAQVKAREVGGDGMGIIGAVAACGLRNSGNDGRFISLPGLRALEGTVSARVILETTPIERIVFPDGERLFGDMPIHTRGWVRPRLRKQRVELLVQRREDGHGGVLVKQKHLDKH